jgi:hypothetical protein
MIIKNSGRDSSDQTGEEGATGNLERAVIGNRETKFRRKEHPIKAYIILRYFHLIKHTSKTSKMNLRAS